MFSLLTNLVQTAVRTISQALKPPAPRAPSPITTRPPAIKAPPPPSFAPIANWGESAASIARRTATWRASPAAVAQTNWAAQEAARAAQRAAEERARKEAARRAKQAQLDSSVRGRSTFLGDLAKKAVSVLGRWTAGKKPVAQAGAPNKADQHKGFDTQAQADSWWRWFNQQTPEKQREVTEYNKTKTEYEKKALATVESLKQGGGTDWLSSIFDKVTFGGTRRAMDARKFAEEQFTKTATVQKKKYEEKTNTFLKHQAAKKAAIEGKKFGSWREYNEAVNEFQNWEKKALADLEYTRAATEGSLSGYKKKSEEKLTNTPGKVASWVDSNILKSAPAQFLGNAWKYTLGSGDENIPSLVTAPSRAINWAGNLIDPKGKKNFHDGKTTQGIPQGKNAWTATLNQRNINMAQPKQVSKDKFVTDLYNKLGVKQTGKTKSQWYKEKQKDIDSMYSNAGTQEKWANYGVEFFADPLFFASGAKVPGLATKANTFAGKVAATQVGQKTGSFLKKVAESKPVKWLGAEHKTRAQVAAEALEKTRKTDFEAAATFLPKFVKNQRDYVRLREAGVDFSVFDELKELADAGDDGAIAMLMRARDGKLSARDRIRYYSPRGKNPRVAKIEDLSRRWTDFTEKMVGPDGIKTDRFGRNKQTYAARIDYGNDHTLDNYDPRRFKKHLGPQSAKEFYANQVNRLFKSDFQPTDKKALLSAASRRADKIKAEYDEFVTPDRTAAGTALKRTKTPYGRVQGAMTKFGPTSLWKKSVLKYRPAWYVNNFLYNTQAAGLAGGARGVVEQFKAMTPKNYRQALNELPGDVRTKIVSEIGKGKVSKFGNYIENVSRIGAYRALKKKGFTHEKAMKRVDRYLLDYKVRNVERPLKAVAPFYSFQKGITKAAVQMPFDRPLAAKAYNQLDRHQQKQFDKDFDSVVPKLKEIGYSDAEIEAIRAEQAKYFKGKLKVGDTYLNTPFNAFSEKGLSQIGFNPYLSAAIESAGAKDQWGMTLKGDKSSFLDRVGTKFPQLELGKKTYSKFVSKPKITESWIGKKGSEGYGMTKEAQGYDKSKPNYQQRLDPSAKLEQDLMAFIGIPRQTKFDTSKLLERKTMQKLKNKYFATDWKSMDFPTKEATREKLFKKYGVTADKFYKGELAKYDSDNTKQIKKLKEEAFEKTRKLFDEYTAQPVGTRNVWATKKLKQLVDSGYFDKNPFLKSFDWTNPGTIAKAHKKIAYDDAKATGNWTAYRSAYGDTRKVSEKKLARDKAVATGDWTAYRKAYGTKTTPFQTDGKFFKSEESMGRYKEGRFWASYAAADKFERRKLLAENPQYNRRANWSDKEWDDFKDRKKADQKARAKAMPRFSTLYSAHLKTNTRKAAPVTFRELQRGKLKLAFKNK